MRERSYSTYDIVRGVAVLATLYLTGGLVWLLPSPGFRLTRLILFVIVIGFAWLGAAGVVRNNSRLVFVGTVGLFLLGFWQAVLWIFMLPTAAVLLFAGLLLQQSNEQH